VNFPFICSNIPPAPVYGVYITQLIRYSRACGSFQDFLGRWLLLKRRLLNQGFLLVKLKSSLRKFYGGHHDLVDRYRISVSQKNPSVLNTSRSFPHSCLITEFVTRLARRVPHVGHKLLTLPEYLSSPWMLWGLYYLIVCFLCNVLYIIVCSFVCFF